MLPVRQISATRNHVDPNRKQFKVPLTAKICDNIGSSDQLESAVLTLRIARNCNSGGIEFGSGTHLEDDSGISSPPLWKMSPPSSPTGKASQFYQCLSPASRLQAIARGQQEMMEMVRNVPESAYELSLKDLVELPHAQVARQETLVEGRELTSDLNQEAKKMEKKKVWKRDKVRSRYSGNQNFLLKFFLPTSLGLKKRIPHAGSCSKISPKPPPVDGDKVWSDKILDREWSDKRFPGGSEGENCRTDSSRSSSTTKSSRSSLKDGFLPSCWTFFCTKKKQSRGT